MDLSEIRQQIDEIDQELVGLFCRRMGLSAQVADYKKANNLPIFAPARERAIRQKVAELAGPEMENYTRVLYSMLFELSRSYQGKRSGKVTPLYRKITDAIENTSKLGNSSRSFHNHKSRRKPVSGCSAIPQLVFRSFPPTVLAVSGSRVRASRLTLSRMRPAPRRRICLALTTLYKKLEKLSSTLS